MKGNRIFLVSSVITYFSAAFIMGYVADSYFFTGNAPIATIAFLFIALCACLYTCFIHTSKKSR